MYNTNLYLKQEIVTLESRTEPAERYRAANQKKKNFISWVTLNINSRTQKHYTS